MNGDHCSDAVTGVDRAQDVADVDEPIL